MNKVVLMGRLTKDPEVRYSQNAEPVAIAKYTLAVNRRFKREGEQDADFINCVVFGKGGEFAERYLRKGMMIAIAGRLQIRSYDDQQGVKHWVTEVIVEEQDFAESKSSFEARNNNAPLEGYGAAFPSGGTSSQRRSESQASNSFAAISETIDDDDLPF